MTEEKTVCDVCPNHCTLSAGQTGLCRVRRNVGGEISPQNYGIASSLALDPIEKKPLARFMQGSLILSVGSYGCNMRCSFCQNHEISQRGIKTGSYDRPSDDHISPEELVEIACETRGSRGNIGIAYTYNEPLVCYEYVRDTARLAHERGLVNVVVTNGCIESHILDSISGHIDAFNVDLKAFTEEGYKRLGGDLETVKRFIKKADRTSHVELTSLIVPGINDSLCDMEREASWIAETDPDITLHITRFFPQYKMTDKGPTDRELMYRLRDVAKKYLEHVYLGNI